MQRFWEILFGLDKGILSREGVKFDFSPRWPWQETINPAVWNFVLGTLAVLLVYYVYRREGRSRPVRIGLGAVRLLLLGFILALLNNPIVRLVETRKEPSVMACAIDDTRSMWVKDFRVDAKAPPVYRIAAIRDLLSAENYKLIRELNKFHTIKFYRYSTGAQYDFELAKGEMEAALSANPQLIEPATRPASTAPAPTTGPVDPDKLPSLLATLSAPTTRPRTEGERKLQRIYDIKADGHQTRVLASLLNVLDNLQGQRIAGIVLLGEGRSSPNEDFSQAIAERLNSYDIRVFPVVVGSEDSPVDLAVEKVQVEDSVYVDDIARLTATIRANGFPAGSKVRVVLKRKGTDELLKDHQGRPLERIIEVKPGEPIDVEMPFKPEMKEKFVGGDVTKKNRSELLNAVVEAQPLPGTLSGEQEELDSKNNTLERKIVVMDTEINVLYVDGYPRWEYRYLTRGMIRDKTVNISTFLQSADPGFVQEADTDRAIQRLPSNIKEMMQFDVVVMGDVDPMKLTDAFLNTIKEFVDKKAGGFGMIAGPRWAPAAYRDKLAIYDILPVIVENNAGGVPEDAIKSGFRPLVTQAGDVAGVFRFLPEKDKNEQFLKNDLQALFWYCQGVRPKPTGTVWAEHPTDSYAPGKKAPLLVAGRYGTGRTLFSAVDDSWRWRFYTGESVFDGYWVRLLRYLATSKKLTERKALFNLDRPVYNNGEAVTARLRVLDPELLQQLPAQLDVDMVGEDGKTVVGKRTLVRSDNHEHRDSYEGTWIADQGGSFEFRLPRVPTDQPRFDVREPRLELAQPEANINAMKRIAEITQGQLVSYASAIKDLPAKLPDMSREVRDPTNIPLWDAPLAMAVFVLLITIEWVLRKVFGML